MQARQRQTGHQQQHHEQNVRPPTSQEKQQQQQQSRYPILQQSQQQQRIVQLLQTEAGTKTAAGGTIDGDMEADQQLTELADAAAGAAPPAASGITRHAQGQQRLQGSWEAKP